MSARLWATARANWVMFDGWSASVGVDPLDLAPDRFFNLVYFWLVRDAAEGEQEKFDARLWRPPKGVEAAPGSPWSPEAESAALGSLAASLGMSGKAPGDTR